MARRTEPAWGLQWCKKLSRIMAGTSPSRKPRRPGRCSACCCRWACPLKMFRTEGKKESRGRGWLERKGDNRSRVPPGIRRRWKLTEPQGQNSSSLLFTSWWLRSCVVQELELSYFCSYYSRILLDLHSFPTRQSPGRL